MLPVIDVCMKVHVYLNIIRTASANSVAFWCAALNLWCLTVIVIRVCICTIYDESSNHSLWKIETSDRHALETILGRADFICLVLFPNSKLVVFWKTVKALFFTGIVGLSFFFLLPVTYTFINNVYVTIGSMTVIISPWIELTEVIRVIWIYVHG
jgi:hypothetical protein